MKIREFKSEDYPIYKTLTTRNFRVNDQYTTPKELAHIVEGNYL